VRAGTPADTTIQRVHSTTETGYGSDWPYGSYGWNSNNGGSMWNDPGIPWNQADTDYTGRSTNQREWYRRQWDQRREDANRRQEQAASDRAYEQRRKWNNGWGY
jgi:hypothetical protein